MKSKKQITIVLAIILLQFSCNNQIEKGSTSNQASGIDRTILPIVPPEREPITELDARNATAPAPFEVKAPKDAPNVVIVLIDDIGFGATSTFGGAISTPSFDRLADNDTGQTFHDLLCYWSCTCSTSCAKRMDRKVRWEI